MPDRNPAAFAALAALTPSTRDVVTEVLSLADGQEGVADFPKPATLLRNIAELLIHLWRLTQADDEAADGVYAGLPCLSRMSEDQVLTTKRELLAAAELCCDTPRSLQGLRRLAPMLCAVATPLDHVCAEGHLLLVAAAMLLAHDADDETRYRIGLELRKLAEAPNNTALARGYQVPADLLQLGSAQEVLDRLPVGEDDDRHEDELFVPLDEAHQEALVKLGRYVRLIWGVERGHRKPGGNGGIRGPSYDTPALRRAPSIIDQFGGLVEERPRVMGADNITFRLRTARIAESENADEEDLDDHDGGHNGHDWGDGSLRRETLISPVTDAPMRRRMLTDALQTPDEEDAPPDDSLWVTARRADPEVAAGWWWCAATAAPSERAMQQLGLVLVAVLGISLDTLDRLVLRQESDSRPGLRLLRKGAEIIGQLHIYPPEFPQPFPTTLCDPNLLHRIDAMIVLAIHPTIATWLARELEASGLPWRPGDDGGEAMVGTLKSLKLRRSLAQLATVVAKADPGSRATLGHTSGLFLLALAKAGTRDPGLAYLVATALRESPPTQAIYTNASVQSLVDIHARTQQQAWQWLCGRPLAPWVPVADPHARYGSQRCATPDAVATAHKLLTGRVSSTLRLSSVMAPAAYLNAVASLVLFRLIASRGLRARGPLWACTRTLFVGSPSWTINDKGGHVRSLALDKTDYLDLIRLADAIARTRMRLPPDAGETFAQLQACESHLRGQRLTGDVSSAFGQLVQANGSWVWRPMTVRDLRDTLRAAGMLLAIGSLRHGARSALAQDGHSPPAIDSLLGHCAWGQEDFHPYAHTSAPLLRAIQMPLVNALRRTFGLPLHA